MSETFRKGSDYPTQGAANVGDLILVFAAGETYTITVQTLIAAIEAAAAEIARKEAAGVNKGDPGDPGFSPTVEITAITGGHRLSITDAKGVETADILDGADGVSPTITITAITGGHRVTVKDATGETHFDVLNGSDGSGSGDMLKSAYDPLETVRTAGGIVAYVERIVGAINTALDEINGEVV